MARLFRFYLSYTNAREGHYGCSLLSGMAVHVRGWDVGVKLTPYGAYGRKARHGQAAEPERPDEIQLTMTGGSHNENAVQVLGTVRYTPAGPVWEPAIPSQ